MRGVWRDMVQVQVSGTRQKMVQHRQEGPKGLFLSCNCLCGSNRLLIVANSRHLRCRLGLLEGAPIDNGRRTVIKPTAGYGPMLWAAPPCRYFWNFFAQTITVDGCHSGYHCCLITPETWVQLLAWVTVQTLHRHSRRICMSFLWLFWFPSTV